MLLARALWFVTGLVAVAPAALLFVLAGNRLVSAMLLVSAGVAFVTGAAVRRLSEGALLVAGGSAASTAVPQAARDHSVGSGHYGAGVKTVGLLLVVMITASVYVWDVAGARRPMTSGYDFVIGEVQETVRELRARVPEAG